ncbi:MAG TPA: hypothetical protein VKR56_01330 [Candidatus Cybelea sp.]|nr:hypothetical protein [Candidatus Cybelea sp.]
MPEEQSSRSRYKARTAAPNIRHALICCPAVAMLAACGSQPPSAMPYTSAPAAHAASRTSRMLAEAKSEDLLYVADGVGGNLFIYSYPRGDEMAEVMGLGEPEGTCVDKAQDVFVVMSDSGRVNEYRHGETKPFARLQDASGGPPLGCSVSPTTGDLAVTNESGPYEGSSNYGPPNITIYKAARGKPKIYSDTSVGVMWFCAYDDKGNLFVDATDDSNNTVLVELPSGGSTLTTIPLEQQSINPGGVQWDGQYVDVADRTGLSGNAVIYQFAIKHGKGVVAGSTVLANDQYVISFWIQGRKLIAGNPGDRTVQFWNYPAGGQATETLTGFYNPAAMAISLAPK